VLSKHGQVHNCFFPFGIFSPKADSTWRPDGKSIVRYIPSDAQGCLARRAKRPLGWLGRILVAATGPAPATYLPGRPAQARAPDYERGQITVMSRKASTSVSPTANTASPSDPSVLPSGSTSHLGVRSAG